jgi:hypothetical protein
MVTCKATSTAVMNSCADTFGGVCRIELLSAFYRAPRYGSKKRKGVF